jgi:hypothetical protein
MGRKGNWNSNETTAIRVPTALVEQLLEMARALDSGDSQDFVQNHRALPASFPPYLVTVADRAGERRYRLPACTLTGAENAWAEREVDRLLDECDRLRLDPLLVLSESIAAWLQPMEEGQ